MVHPRRVRRRRSRASAVFWYVVLVILALLAVGPIIWAVSSSLKTNSEIFATPPRLITRHLAWSNYRAVFNLIPFWRELANTTIYAVAVTAGQLFFCSLAGYAFARKRFRGRDALFVTYLATLMVPVTVVIIPQFILMRWFGWVNTMTAMIVPGLLGSAFGTYLMRQFFVSLPSELEEAAVLDSANQWQIYWYVMLPLARPALAVLAVLSMVTVWNDFLWPLVMIQNDDISTLTLGLVHLQGQNATNYPVLMAASILVLLPPTLAYLLAQRWFVRGIAQSGLGGR
jgi:multiple sugar transport system permease protein